VEGQIPRSANLETTMIVLNKRQKEAAILDSLFNPGGTLACLKKERYCTGKYQKTVIGKEITPCSADIRVIWAERRTDRDGAYYALYCLSSD